MRRRRPAARLPPATAPRILEARRCCLCQCAEVCRQKKWGILFCDSLLRNAGLRVGGREGRRKRGIERERETEREREREI